MVDTRTGLVFATLLGAAVLFFALKTGGIGGSRAGADRGKNPVLYWMGVSITGFVELMLVIVLIASLV